jgi:hypothetical protein
MFRTLLRLQLAMAELFGKRGTISSQFDTRAEALPPRQGWVSGLLAQRSAFDQRYCT